MVPAVARRLARGRARSPSGGTTSSTRPCVDVPAFAIDVHNVTNERFLEFVEAGGYRKSEWWSPEAFAWLRQEGIEHPRFWTRHQGSWQWRGMFDAFDLPPAWPVYVSQAEAAAYTRWKGGTPANRGRVPRAAFGEP